jgi:iron complex transport system ATP-binding protein
MKTLLHLAKIGFEFPGRKVLDNMSLELPQGACAALIGPNGAGKTTLLRLAAGILEPSYGTITLGGQSLASLGRKERSCLIALVPQQLDVPFDFSVQQIVEQGRTPYLGFLRGPVREDRLAVEKALDQADVFALRHRTFNELSGGERQRVKIALGLAQQPKLLLLDEPTQNLDIGRQAELIALLHHLRDQGITILASIHDIHLVHENFTAVHLLAPNRPMLSGPASQIVTPANLASAFNCSNARHPMLIPQPAAMQEAI